MDFVPLIDAIGEPATAALIGTVLGLAFGALALISGFCTRSAVLDVTRRRDGRALTLWLVAFTIAVAGTQALAATGALALGDTRFFASAQSLSGAVIGGALFGIGMVLARGCASRLVVLASAGNLRALFSVAIIALTAWATIGGPLSGLRQQIGGLATIGQNDVATLIGLGALAAPLIIATLVLAALTAIVRNRPGWALVAGGISIGALIPAGWWLTQQLSWQVFEPVAVDSLSYLRPLAGTVAFAGNGADPALLDVDLGLIAGTAVGAFLAAVTLGWFRIATFGEPDTPSIGRYGLGAALMGFGGVLAAGCTIGAGLTGGSALAISALIALGAMAVSAAVTDWVLDRPRSLAATPRIAPAE